MACRRGDIGTCQHPECGITDAELASLDPLTHPDADKLKPPTWDEPGECICGAPLPPQKTWDRAGQDWANILCSACGRGYVDEEDFFAIYDPDDVEAAGGADDWKVKT